MSATPKLSDDAFAYYVALGVDRSYDAVARQYGVHKRTVVRTANRERWTERFEAIAEKTRERTDAKLADTLHERDMRHRKLVLAIAARAAKALQQHELGTAMEAVRAAEVAVKLERLISGQSSENTALTVERTTRDEVARFLTMDPDLDEWDDDDEPENGAVAAPE